MKNKKIIICVPTYKRPIYLEKNINSIINQNFDSTYEIVIVDNDPKKSAKKLVDQFKNDKIKCNYFIEQKRGIAAVRNKCIEICKEKNADYLIFIDNDEIADKNWLQNLLDTSQKYNAEVVSGPVLCKFEDTSIKDIIKRIYFHRKRAKTGTISQHCATGNVLINMNIFKKIPSLTFDEDFGLMGGEDTLFFMETKSHGINMVWCDEAIAHEFISKERSQLKNCLLRSFYSGNSSFYIFKIRNGLFKAIVKSIVNILILCFEFIRLLLFIIIFNKIKLYKICKKMISIIGFITGLFNYKNKQYHTIFGTYRFREYRNDGWGLSKLAFIKLHDIMDLVINDKGNLNILEFGSGISTQFLIDTILINGWTNMASITSFDNDEEYMYKIKNDRVNKILQLNNCRLLQCEDIEYKDMFISKKYNSEYMRIKHTPIHTRQKNCFYDIIDSDLKQNYDLIILDGPHGNGRSISFLRIKNNISFPCYFLIDDVTHYNFEKEFLHIFSAELIFRSKMLDINNLHKFLSRFSKKIQDKMSPWNRGGDFVIYKINSVK